MIDRFLSWALGRALSARYQISPGFVYMDASKRCTDIDVALLYAINTYEASKIGEKLE